MFSHHHRRFAAKSISVTPVPTIQTATAGSALSVNYPSGLVLGAQLIMFVHAQDKTITYGTLAGWTLVADADGVGFWTRTVDGSEPSSITFGAIATAVSGTIIQVLNGTYDVVGANSAANNTAVAPSITATGAGLLFAFFFENTGGAHSQTYTTPSGMTPLVSISTTTLSFAIFTQIISAGATGTRTSSASINNARGCLLSVKSA